MSVIKNQTRNAGEDTGRVLIICTVGGKVNLSSEYHNQCEECNKIIVKQSINVVSGYIFKSIKAYLLYRYLSILVCQCTHCCKIQAIKLV